MRIQPKPSENKKPKLKPRDGSNIYHVLERKDGKWIVKRVGASRALKAFSSKEAAINFANELAGDSGTVIIH